MSTALVERKHLLTGTHSLRAFSGRLTHICCTCPYSSWPPLRVKHALLIEASVEDLDLLLVVELSVGAAVLVILLDYGIDSGVLVAFLPDNIVYWHSEHAILVNEVDPLLVGEPHLDPLRVASGQVRAVVVSAVSGDVTDPRLLYALTPIARSEGLISRLNFILDDLLGSIRAGSFLYDVLWVSTHLLFCLEDKLWGRDTLHVSQCFVRFYLYLSFFILFITFKMNVIRCILGLNPFIRVTN